MLFDRFHKQFDPSEKVIQDENCIVDRQQIIQVLNNVHRDHCLLEAIIANHPDNFTTTILGINPKTGIMALDEITPQTGHQLFLKYKSIHLSGRTDGVEMECDLKLIALKNKAKIHYYQVAIPEKMIYAQRRNDHRVQFIGISHFHGHLEKQKQKLVKGYIADLSMHGMGVVLKNHEDVERGDKLTACVLQLPNEEQLYFNLEVCFVQQIRQRGIIRIGCRFLDLAKQDGNRIAKIIRKQERKHAQIVRD